MIHGITITLFETEQTGVDDFGRPIFEPKQGEEVENVLVQPASSDDVISEMNLSGKRIVYNIAIPKGDTHNWKDATLEFFGKTWRTVGLPKEGIEDMLPLKWNKQIMVEEYE